MLPILKQNKPVHILQSYFFRSILISSFHPHIRLPITLFPTSYLSSISLLRHASQIPQPTPPPWFYQRNISGEKKKTDALEARLHTAKYCTFHIPSPKTWSLNVEKLWPEIPVASQDGFCSTKPISVKIHVCQIKCTTSSQSIQRLATGRTVPASNPGGGARFSTPVQAGRVIPPAICTMGT